MAKSDTHGLGDSSHGRVFPSLESTHGHQVLYVCGDESSRRDFVRTFGESEIYASPVRTAGEALAELKHHPFAAVVVDYDLPEMNGVDVLHTARNMQPDAVRIMIADEDHVRKAVMAVNQVGLFRFLVKPWTSSDLREAVQDAVQQFCTTHENRMLKVQLGAKCSELSGLAKRLERDVQSRTSNLLLGLVGALDLRDTETQWHSRRVALYAHRLAEELGLKGDALLTVERGALLHDVGKIGVPDTILHKPGKLTEDEWTIMRRHSEHGFRILQDIDFLGDARRLVHEHHERWDGTGYPQGTAGRKICAGARVFAIIDTYDAMTSDRPYRKAEPHEKAIEEIARMSGAQFDPEMVSAWMCIPKEHFKVMRTFAGEPDALSVETLPD
ncbi:MAG: HD domain-containing protein [Deltaproteobacteria bacterium]|nr:HD domain-containing protein [Deltaproteobacteria bacterium]